MSFTHRPQPGSGLASMNPLQILQLMDKPADMRAMLQDIVKAEEALRVAQAEARAEQTSLMEHERQLAERKTALDADWVRLRQAQSDLDDAKAGFAKDKVRDTSEIESRYLANRARAEELDKRESGLNGRAVELDKRETNLAAEADRLSAAAVDRALALDAREAAVAERESAADELATLMAKVGRRG